MQKKDYYATLPHNGYANFGSSGYYLTTPWDSVIGTTAQAFSIRWRGRFMEILSGSGVSHTIISMGVGGTTNFSWDLKYHDAPKSFRTSVRKETGGAQINLDGSVPVSAGQWYTAAATFSAANQRLRLYVNNALQGTVTVNAALQAIQEPVYIASLAGGIQGFLGDMDLLELYNRELTAEEVVNGGDSGLLMNLPFNGNTLDFSSYARPITRNGQILFY